MIYVVFSAEPVGNGGAELVCGPYRSAQIVGPRLWVMECAQPFVLAFQEAERWRVHDGLGDEGPVYKLAMICSCLPAGLRDMGRKRKRP